MKEARKKELVSLATSFFDGTDYRPLSAASLADRLETKKNEFDELVETLYELEEAGVAVHVDGRGWCSPRREGWVVGTLKVNRRGFGFVRPAREDGLDDIYISTRKLKDGHDGDRVLVKVRKPRRKRRDDRAPKGPEGRVISVLARSPRIILGTYYDAARDGGVVEPLDRGGVREIFIPRGKECGAQEEDRVLVRIVEGASIGGLPPGEVVELAEPEGTWRADLQIIAAEYGLREEFPREVMAEVKAIDGITAADLADRVDLRELPVVTVDPRDAKDFDDAVHLERHGDGWKLGVFIADVAHYVKPGTAIDREAYVRGTSAYLPGKVFPMLPEKLSNGLCSLSQGDDRLAKAALMEIGPDGSLVGWRVERVVIRSARRYSYGEVQEILDGADPEPGEESLADMLREMSELRDVLTEHRKRRGALDLDIAEQRILLDDDGEVLEIGPRERTEANRLVEEFMLLANEAVARTATEAEISVLRRVHPEPPEEDLEAFRKFCAVLVPGIPVRGAESFQGLVEKLRGRGVAPIVSLALLRTLTRAEYSATKGLHFALANDEYCHFTSPIRRYPDLQVHRALDAALFDRRPKLPKSVELPGLEQMAEYCSKTERQAEEAEREMSKLRAISWLHYREGEHFTGIVTAVFDYGFFVRLDDNLVEGMVHISSLKDDYYILHESQFALRGRNTGKSFRLGDAVEVLLYRADSVNRQVDLRFVQHRKSRDDWPRRHTGKAKAGRKKDTGKKNPRKKKSRKGRRVTRGK